jgi:hypothetical protein
MKATVLFLVQPEIEEIVIDKAKRLGVFFFDLNDCYLQNYYYLCNRH